MTRTNSSLRRLVLDTTVIVGALDRTERALWRAD